ncbi:hypothetical protein [Streptomyces sp. NPDC059994]|uniref:hypothetical protein n=1 Tax=Streptomyces sp. NPDC059994 TaxID=3347029 RepID=UPI00367C6C6A
MAASENDHTFIARFRLPRRVWDAYETATARQGTDRSSDLLSHVRSYLAEHGTTEEQSALAAGEQELAERRARTGGRPSKRTTS